MELIQNFKMLDLNCPIFEVQIHNITKIWILIELHQFL